MIAMIVDDNSKIREWAAHLSVWEAAGFNKIITAADGDTALLLAAEHRPELLLLEWNVRGTYGSELLHAIQAVAPQVKIVLMTNHYDLQSLREAVKWGGSDLLLKPFDESQLADAIDQALQKRMLEDQMKEQDRIRSYETNQTKPVYRDKLLSELVDEPGSFTAHKSALIREFPSMQYAKRCRVAILSMDTISHAVRSKFDSRRELLLFSFLNICNELLLPSEQGVAFRYRLSEREITLLLWADPDYSVSLLAAIHHAIERTLHTRADFGLGTTVSFPNQLPQSFQEAGIALRRRNLLDEGGWIHTFDGIARSPEPNLLLADYEESMRLAVLSGKTERIQLAVRSWIGAVRQLKRITVEQLDLWRMEYMIIKERWTRYFSDGASYTDLRLPSESSVFLVPLDEKGRLSLSLWQDELTESLLRLAKRLHKNHLPSGSVMEQVEAYLHQNYHRNLTLQHIAERFYLSREYISRKFKQHFGENIVEYLGAIRMNKARTLLSESTVNISEVAQMVGYSDEKYFSKVFKKVVGMSPTAYRKTFKTR